MGAIIRYAASGDVVSLHLKVPAAEAHAIEDALGRDWHEIASAGVASFEIRDAETLRLAGLAARCVPAAQAALEALDAEDAVPGDTWIVVGDEGRRVRPGELVELLVMDDPYTHLSAGDVGTVVGVRINGGAVSVDVRWEGGSTLSLLPDAGDRWRAKEAM